MPIRSPPRGSEAAVLACAGFLIGVLLHAARPFTPTAAWVLALLAAMAVGVWNFNNKQDCFIVPLFHCFLLRKRVSVSNNETMKQFNNPDRQQDPHYQTGLSRASFLLALLILSFALGLYRHDLTLPRDDDPLMRARGTDISFIARVTNVRQYDSLLGVISIDGKRIVTRSQIVLARGHGYQNAGETWAVTCRIESAIKIDAESGAASKNASFNARDGAFFTCKGSISARKIKDAAWWDPRALLAGSRTAITARITRILPGDEGSLLAGILYGDRGLSADAAQAFRFAGMTHIIAVSGSNVTIVVVCFVPLFLALGYRRRFAIILSVVAILTFVLFVGASASVVRAAIMGSLALLGRAFGRRAAAGRLLVIAAAILTAMSPWTLAFDAGFALSFLATWGLIAMSEPVSARLRFIPESFGLRDAAATTTAATLATFPYQLWAFSSASLAGLLTNLLVIPFLGATMLSGAVAVVLGDAIPVTALPANGFLSYMLAVANTSQRFPFLLVPIYLPTGVLFATYLALALISSRISAKNRAYPQNRTSSIDLD
jgi:ComEC/Rec2-related protein